MHGLLFLPPFSTKTAAIEVTPCQGTTPGLTGLIRSQKPPSGYRPELCPGVSPLRGHHIDNIWPKIQTGAIKAWPESSRPPRQGNLANSDLASRLSPAVGLTP